MERETQMTLLDKLLYNPKNAKEKRNLIVAVAASGMGKSAFVDEYSRRLLNTAKNHQHSSMHPIAITFNTAEFGGSEGEASVDLAARLLMSYYHQVVCCREFSVYYLTSPSKSEARRTC
jgi:hypothetical protein